MLVAVMGAGGWGTALSVLAARAGHEVRLWSRNAGVVEEVNRERVNRAYLAGREIPSAVGATADVVEALAGAGLVILAAPSHATRELLGRMKGGADAGAVY